MAYSLSPIDPALRRIWSWDKTFSTFRCALLLAWLLILDTTYKGDKDYIFQKIEVDLDDLLNTEQSPEFFEEVCVAAEHRFLEDTTIPDVSFCNIVRHLLGDKTLKMECMITITGSCICNGFLGLINFDPFSLTLGVTEIHEKRSIPGLLETLSFKVHL